MHLPSLPSCLPHLEAQAALHKSFAETFTSFCQTISGGSVKLLKTSCL